MTKVELTHLDINTCRLCLEEHDCYKDLFNEYIWMGQQEIYNEMLLETFNISPHKDSISQIKAICNTCIMKLRAALDFKKQIWECEKKLFDYFSNFKDSIVGDSALWKVEELKEELLGDNLDVYDQSDDQKDEIQSTIKLLDFDKIMENFTKNTELKVKKVRKKVKSNKKNGGALKIAISKDTRTSSKHKLPKIKIEKDLITNNPKGFIKRTKRTKASVDNALTLLEHSNMTPFSWQARKRFVCFCCPAYFANFVKLKDHTRNSHVRDDLLTELRKWHKSVMYKVDVSSLQCTLCNQDCKDMVALKSHLTQLHGMTFEDAKDILIPFLLDKDLFQCYFCNEKYHGFHSLNMHINCHYFNHICEVCGMSFKNTANLDSHKKGHTGRVLKCLQCDIVFTSLYKKRKHDVVIHDKGPIHRCPECPERFLEFRQKMKHQSEVHKSALPEYKCDQCEKKFLRNYLLSRHVRREHLLECNFKCDVCDSKFFTKGRLQCHMINHFGERVHECTFCKKSYARKKTLREHLKIHLNIRKWICCVCGEAFVQNCSLKNHMKKHDM